MSIALDNNRVEQNNGGFLRRNKISPFNLSPILDSKDRTVMRVVVKEERENGFLDPCSSSSSSSIGMNSDVDNDDFDEKNGHDDDDDEQEVQSKLKTNPFDSAVDALEEALPIRKGISKFYNGKSKSFASLTETASASSSIKDITKPGNAYSRKRKNLLAYNLFYEKNRTSFNRSPGIGGGIAKRPTTSSRSTLARAVAMNNCESHIDENGDFIESNGINDVRKPSLCSSLLPPPWRSFSLVDLQHCAVSASAVNTNLSSPLMGKRTKTDEVS